jgi:hypothetical protein
MPTKTKLEATVATVKEAAGRTWFDCSDEGTCIVLSSRDHGDVGAEIAGKADKDEGSRLRQLLRKVFKPAAWVVEYDVIDEWVHVSVRKEPLTKREKADRARKDKIAKLDQALKAIVAAANEERKKLNCRLPFSSFVYDGHYSQKATLKVMFGKRFLYPSHMGSGFVFADEETASEAIKPLLEKLPSLKLPASIAWTRTIREATPRRTGNYPPPHNVIEEEGYIEYEADIRAL